MNLRLQNKGARITDGSRRIGAAIVSRLEHQGADEIAENVAYQASAEAGVVTRASLTIDGRSTG